MIGARQRRLLAGWTFAAALFAVTMAGAAEPVVTNHQPADETNVFKPAYATFPWTGSRWRSGYESYPPVRMISYPKTAMPLSPWYFLTEAVAMKRDSSIGGAFAVRTDRQWTEIYDDTPAFVGWEFTDTQTALIGADTIGLDFAGGGRALLGVRLGDWYSFEVSYLGLNQWDTSSAVTDDTEFTEQLFDAFGAPLLNGNGYPQPGSTYTGAIFSPFTDFGDPAVIGLDYNNLVSVAYSSSFHDVEWNFRQSLAMPHDLLQMSVMLGGRYMDIDENFRYYSESAYPVALTRNDIRTATGNVMLGAQIGALFEVCVDRHWWIDFEIKGAIFDNLAKHRSWGYVSNENGAQVAVHDAPVEEHHAAGALDLDLNLTWKITQGLQGRIGYRALFIEGVALAPENLQRNIGLLTSGPTQLDADGGVVYHGPHIGLTGAW